jgi:hypothetical protein
MFWVVMTVVMLVVIGVSVLIGMSLKNSSRHKVSRDEMLALKSSGAFSFRKENQP